MWLCGDSGGGDLVFREVCREQRKSARRRRVED